MIFAQNLFEIILHKQKLWVTFLLIYSIDLIISFLEYVLRQKKEVSLSACNIK